MPLPAFLASAADAWAALYDAHHAVSVTVRFVHLSALLVGGGTALALDRQTLKAAGSGAPEKAAALVALRASHRVVVPALTLVAVAGLLLTAADRDTFLASRFYWSKLGLVALLLLNGVALLGAERTAERSGGSAGWGRLRLASTVSVLLWLAILYAGLWLTVAA